MSTQKVLLISEKQIKDQSIVEQNVDGKLLSKIVLNVQEIQLKPILGQGLYDSVLAEVLSKAGDTEYEILEDIKIMLDEYIIPFLIYATLVDFVVFGSYKLSNKGLVKLNDNAAQNVNPNDTEYVKNYYDNYLGTYKNRLINYLKDKELLDKKNDTNITGQSIGWYLDLNNWNCN
jgi:hypothetical protein